jgi:hypothetical protein
VLFVCKEYYNSNKLFFKCFVHNIPIFLVGNIWPNIGICQTLGFSILKMSPLQCFFFLDRRTEEGEIFDLRGYRVQPPEHTCTVLSYTLQGCWPQ